MRQIHSQAKPVYGITSSAPIPSQQEDWVILALPALLASSLGFAPTHLSQHMRPRVDAGVCAGDATNGTPRKPQAATRAFLHRTHAPDHPQACDTPAWVPVAPLGLL
eukprot:EG_transcript_19321